jgi:hypothetical protein
MLTKMIRSHQEMDSLMKSMENSSMAWNSSIFSWL